MITFHLKNCNLRNLPLLLLAGKESPKSGLCVIRTSTLKLKTRHGMPTSTKEKEITIDGLKIHW